MDRFLKPKDLETWPDDLGATAAFTACYLWKIPANCRGRSNRDKPWC